MIIGLTTKRLAIIGIAFFVGTFQPIFAQSNRVRLDLLLHIHGSDSGSRIGIFFSPLGDINGDGYDDIALASLASFSPREVMVYYGGISPDTIKDLTLRFGDIDGNRDFDGDGINDISIVTYDSTWLIYKGFRDSIETVPSDSISVPERESKFKFIEGGYVNLDPYADYLISSWSVEIDSNRIRYYESPFINRVSSWEYVEGLSQHDLRSFGFIDYNCDSFQDIYLGLLAHVDSVGSVKIFYGPTFSSTPDVIIEAPVGFDSVNVRRFVESCSNIGDVDGDGCDDLYVQFELTPLIYRG
ncbi:MAG: FG-GAP repeat protein [candidate division Zixibacteria bacterium]|nr:FG-GAP repeat protein [candidate division Zixibacteria bacterium]